MFRAFFDWPVITLAVALGCLGVRGYVVHKVTHGSEGHLIGYDNVKVTLQLQNNIYHINRVEAQLVAEAAPDTQAAGLDGLALADNAQYLLLNGFGWGSRRNVHRGNDKERGTKQVGAVVLTLPRPSGEGVPKLTKGLQAPPKNLLSIRPILADEQLQLRCR